MTTQIENAFKTLRKSFVKIDDDGVYVLNESLINDTLRFKIALAQAKNAVANGEITVEEFYSSLIHPPTTMIQ